MPELRLPTSLRRALIEAMGGWGPYTVREIDSLFQSHDFFDIAQDADEQGVRRTRAAEYLDRIDWGVEGERRKLLDLTEDVLVHYPEGGDEPSTRPGRVLRNVLRRLGVQTAESGALVMSRIPSSLIGADVETGTQPANGDDPFDIWPPDRVRVFLSHVSRHKTRIAALAADLESSEFACFVAHEEIEPSLEWQRVIESALSSCDVLVAYVTPDWPQSKWCDQEVGWGLSRGVVVVTADAGEMAYGFIARLQAIPARTEAADRDLARKIVKAIVVAVFAGEASALSTI